METPKPQNPTRAGVKEILKQAAQGKPIPLDVEDEREKAPEDEAGLIHAIASGEITSVDLDDNPTPAPVDEDEGDLLEEIAGGRVKSVDLDEDGNTVGVNKIPPTPGFSGPIDL